MSLTVTCPDCDKTLKVKDEAAGKRIRCPGCSTVIPIPAKSNDADDDFLSGLDEAVSIKQKGRPVVKDDDFGDMDLPPAKSRSSKPVKKTSVKKKSADTGKSLLGRIWGGVVTTVVVLVGLAGLFGRINKIVANRPVQAANWTTFRHPSGSAQIDMPGTPQFNPQQSINGAQTYSLGQKNYQMSLSVMPMDSITANAIATNPAAADLIFEQLKTLAPGSKLVSSRRMTAGTIQGFEMKMDVNGVINQMRTYLFPGAIIGIEFITHNETTYAAERERFFNSMRGSDGNLINGLATPSGVTPASPSGGAPPGVSVPNMALDQNPAGSLADARRRLKTKLIRQERSNRPVPDPPAAVARKVHYDAPSGKLAAYLTTIPQDGAKHPAIVWITGGDCNSIDDDFFKTPQPNNDQTADAFRKSGIITMYPSLRGGNDNPGFKESFLGEVDDVIAAADFLSKQDGVDSSRIYLGGHSTGGTVALLAAESTDRFRAVFSFGPTHDIRVYDDAFLTIDRNNSLEFHPRNPAFWLKSIQSRLFVMEGTLEPCNSISLMSMSTMCRDPKATFLPVPGANHFNILAPVTKLIAEKIVKDEGPTTNIKLAMSDLILKFAP